MKLSLAWIFDHIKAQLKDIDIDDLIKRFSAITAEVEHVERIIIDLSNFTMARVIAVTDKGVRAESAEFKKEFFLPHRADVVINNTYLVIKEQKNYKWARLQDIGSTKDGLLPALWCAEEDIKAGWKDTFETQDYILEIDNKALTHRPDMWGHRGVAREVAAILNKKLIPEEEFLVSKPIKHYTHNVPVTAHNPYTLEISHTPNSCGQPCKRLAGLYISSIENRASIIRAATRLARVDARPIDALVDTTNYVMFDIGQPMHAFDAETIKTHRIVARCAYEGEKLKLLDGETVTLADTDYVITDGEKPLALAGIMGGQETAVTHKTHSLFLESANFDATTIRKTSVRVKKRTEASARFEKSLDPNQNTHALLRYLKLLHDYSINYTAADSISSIGQLAQEKIITVRHDLIVTKIGAHVDPGQIEDILTKLGFGFQAHYENSQTVYSVTVPTYRATKDIELQEDIVEEIVRFIGYSTIIPQAPTRAMISFDTRALTRVREIKHHMAFAMAMHEAQTYAFFDEEFLKILDYSPQDALRIANPLSEHWQRLVTSLVPNMLKCVYTNKAQQETLRFFELNRVWFFEEKAVESKEIAGIFYESKKVVDFYDYKALLCGLFDMLKVSIEWAKPTKELDVWYNKNQTAELLYQGNIVGRAGKIALPVLNKITDQGDAFIFELDGSFLVNVSSVPVKYKPLAKYQETDLDISMLVSLRITVQDLQQAIAQADKRITGVTLVDFFEKPQWGDQKSVTLRFTVYDEHKTLTKDELDHVWNNVLSAVKKYNVVVR